MTYDQSVLYLLSLGRELASPRQAHTAKFGLENITALASRLSHPERSYRTIGWSIITGNCVMIVP